MPNRTLKSVIFEVGSSRFKLSILTSFEVLLELTNPKSTDPFDHFGTDADGFARPTTASETSPLKVFKTVITEVTAFLNSYSPPYLWVSVGGDASRISLYAAIGKHMEKRGHGVFTHAPGSGHMYLYRANGR